MRRSFAGPGPRGRSQVSRVYRRDGSTARLPAEPPDPGPGRAVVVAAPRLGGEDVEDDRPTQTQSLIVTTDAVRDGRVIAHSEDRSVRVIRTPAGKLEAERGPE